VQQETARPREREGGGHVTTSAVSPAHSGVKLLRAATGFVQLSGRVQPCGSAWSNLAGHARNTQNAALTEDAGIRGGLAARQQPLRDVGGLPRHLDLLRLGPALRPAHSPARLKDYDRRRRRTIPFLRPPTINCRRTMASPRRATCRGQGSPIPVGRAPAVPKNGLTAAVISLGNSAQRAWSPPPTCADPTSAPAHRDWVDLGAAFLSYVCSMMWG
jgi:hypothetical protein